MTPRPPHSLSPLPAERLRVPTEEDAYAWHRVFDDPEVMEFHGGKAAEVSVYEELTARQRRHDAELGFCFWTILDEDGGVAGFTGAQPWPHPEWGPVGAIEIGWRLGRSAWGQGLATGAALTTLERLRAAGVPEVVAMVNAENHRSIAVVERLGMELAEVFLTPVGKRRGHRYRLAL
ncbi:GNAT family N-acetyltransferase [Streptomyces sp. NPDC050418]|uniref:GNAT family N-acetyltransferase n=1 Tax=Streptomyces sp. NPDC050418 TaxID=3365612 RepID=UPI00378BBB08